MSFQGQNPARQHGDILLSDAHASFIIRKSVIIYNATNNAERVKILSVIVYLP